MVPRKITMKKPRIEQTLLAKYESSPQLEVKSAMLQWYAVKVFGTKLLNSMGTYQ